MFCKCCGKAVKDNWRFCDRCGARITGVGMQSKQHSYIIPENYDIHNTTFMKYKRRPLWRHT